MSLCGVKHRLSVVCCNWVTSQLQAEQAAREGTEHALWLRNQVDVPLYTHRVMAESLVSVFFGVRLPMVMSIRIKLA